MGLADVLACNLNWNYMLIAIMYRSLTNSSTFFIYFKLDAANVLVIGTEKSAKEDDPGMIFFFR